MGKLIVWLTDGKSKTLDNVSNEEASKAMLDFHEGNPILIRYNVQKDVSGLWATDNVKRVAGFSFNPDE